MRNQTALVIVCAGFLAGGPHPLAAQAAKHYEPYYLQPSLINFASVVPRPPANGSPEQRADLAAVHLAERNRTPMMVKQARADDLQEDIFLYATVLGPHFNAEELPLTAALSRHLRNDVGVVSPPLKARYDRPRPFVIDPSIHAVCEKKMEGSYPSGHASVGYLTGLVLAQMLPERANEILARADAYAQDRVVCGVHYPTDIHASKALALAMLGQIAASAKFQEDLRLSVSEIRKKEELLAAPVLTR